MKTSNKLLLIVIVCIQLASVAADARDEPLLDKLTLVSNKKAPTIKRIIRVETTETEQDMMGEVSQSFDDVFCIAPLLSSYCSFILI